MLKIYQTKISKSYIISTCKNKQVQNKEKQRKRKVHLKLI